WEAHETARVHYAARRRGRVAARGARAAARPDGGLDYGVAPLGSKQLGRIDGGIALDPNPKNRWCRGNCLSGCLPAPLANDTSAISLAQPMKTISPVMIGGQIPAPGTVLVSAGYGDNGTGTFCCNGIDNKRRNMTIEFGAYANSIFGVPLSTQRFLLAQFRDPLNP